MKKLPLSTITALLLVVAGVAQANRIVTCPTSSALTAAAQKDTNFKANCATGHYQMPGGWLMVFPSGTDIPTACQAIYNSSITTSAIPVPGQQLVTAVIEHTGGEVDQFGCYYQVAEQSNNVFLVTMQSSNSLTAVDPADWVNFSGGSHTFTGCILKDSENCLVNASNSSVAKTKRLVK